MKNIRDKLKTLEFELNGLSNDYKAEKNDLTVSAKTFKKVSSYLKEQIALVKAGVTQLSDVVVEEFELLRQEMQQNSFE